MGTWFDEWNYFILRPKHTLPEINCCCHFFKLGKCCRKVVICMHEIPKRLCFFCILFVYSATEKACFSLVRFIISTNLFQEHVGICLAVFDCSLLGSRTRSAGCSRVCGWFLLRAEADGRGSAVAWKAMRWGKKSQALLEISTKERNGGLGGMSRLCLESNKTRRLGGRTGSSFGSLDWFQRIGPTCGEWVSSY